MANHKSGTKFLLDQNLSAAAAEILRADGLDLLHTREVGLATADDRVILIWCREKGRILITLDADCHAILALSGATSPSVVRIRLEGLRDLALAELNAASSTLLPTISPAGAP